MAYLLVGLLVVVRFCLTECSCYCGRCFVAFHAISSLGAHQCDEQFADGDPPRAQARSESSLCLPRMATGSSGAVWRNPRSAPVDAEPAAGAASMRTRGVCMYAVRRCAVSVVSWGHYRSPPFWYRDTYILYNIRVIFSRFIVTVTCRP